MPEVSCSVANCEYWKKGNKCNADSIMIEIDQHASANFNEEFASESFVHNHQDTAGEAAATCCQTFKHKSSS
ncbi:DUF1540 domain-containing protein [Paenibacillus ferrarius]|uniref:DUF1540 domain-containing protein n=1 Tax=Paenibacillus ferrarius TaxID=1469647 RepID=UPI003D28BB69